MVIQIYYHQYYVDMKKFCKVLAIVGMLVAFSWIAEKVSPKMESYALEYDSVVYETEQARVAAANRTVYLACRENLLKCIALVEDFHSKPYYDGCARWTIGYGTTIYPNGDRVTSKDKEISKEFAKECVFSHCDQHVWPWIEKYVTRELTPSEMLGTCMFIYNVGGENFAARDADGNALKKCTGRGKNKKIVELTPSCFLQAINNNDDAVETAEKMTGFRSAGGKMARGLLKRHWVQGAIYLGLLNPFNVNFLEPGGFYGSSVDYYYTSQKGDFWKYDFSRNKIKEFIRDNSSINKNVLAII
jgi:GH24 family phage-related lysozyme (muramidase)